MYLPGSSPAGINGDYPDYVQLVKNLNRFVDFARTLLQKVKPPPLPEVDRIDYYRDKYLELFSKQEQIDFSSQAHKEGGCSCCYQDYPPFKVYDIFYLLTKNPEFRFPESDLKLLAVENTRDGVRGNLGLRNKCVFLGSSGCQLKNNRPALCLAFTGCRGINPATHKLLAGLGKQLFKELYPRKDGIGHLNSLYSPWYRKFIDLVANSEYAKYIEEANSECFIFDWDRDRFLKLRFAAEYFPEFNKKELRIFGDAMSFDKRFWNLVDRIVRVHNY